jgi:hypothetical protein
MKLRNEGLGWAIFLLLAGAFLLLKNLNVFGGWGEVAWGGLFAAAGLGFLIWLLFDFGHWWRAVPGFTLLSIGALVLVGWRGIDLGDWAGSLVMFGMALGFWASALVARDNWWTVIPAGVLTVLGVLTGLQERLSAAAWLAAFFIGLGLVFLLLYLLRLGQHDSWWAAIPAGALALFGVVTLAGTLGSTSLAARWWPTLLLAAGLGLAVILLLRPTAGRPQPVEPPPDAIQPAKGTSVTEALPEVEAPTPSKPQPAPTAGQPDIYAVLAQQPKEPQN